MQEKEWPQDDTNDEDGSVREAFDRSEMLACSKCGRMNPPNRANCLYCGEVIEAPDSLRSKYWPVVRGSEAWESGYNVIVKWDPEELSEATVAEIADGLRIGRDVAAGFLRTGEFLPISRVSSRSEAEAVELKIRSLGLECFVLPDEDLRPGDAQLRLKAMRFVEGGIVPQPFSGETVAQPFVPSLIVEGSIVRKRLDSREGRKREAGRIVDAVEMGFDEAVMDIYSPGSATGYRVRTEGFDFSVLGAAKAFTAAENMRLLAGELRRRFPEAEFADSYKDLRHLLGICWPTSESVSSEGFERKSFGGYTKRKSQVTSNDEQFLRYSRLRQVLLMESE